MKRLESKRYKIPIMFIIPSLCRAGAETQVVNLLNSLDCNKFKIHLFTYLDNIDQYSRLKKNRINFYNHVRRNRFDFNLIKSISKLIDKSGIEILHCTFTHATFLGWLARIFSKRKPKLISAIHTTVHKSFKADFYDRVLYQWILRRCDRVAFVCNQQKEYWTSKYQFLNKNSVVIYNGVDTSHFDPFCFEEQGRNLRSALSIPNDAPVICCIANFRPEKAHHILVNAFVNINPDSFLLLAGDGETRPAIEDLVRQKGLDTRVRFLGEVADVRPVLAGSNVCVLSSVAVETFSMAMLESMSMGVPMVAPDIGGLSEAIKVEETGYIVPVGNVKSLGTALKKMVNDHVNLDLMSQNCRELVVEKFSEKIMVEATEDLLFELV